MDRSKRLIRGAGSAQSVSTLCSPQVIAAFASLSLTLPRLNLLTTRFLTSESFKMKFKGREADPVTGKRTAAGFD